MSWVVDEWKEGLPTKTLQKIQELESQLDKLKKERQQRQFQLESLEAAFQKQKQKVESEKNEVTAMKRENQSLLEICDNQEKTRQKMAHDQQVKDTQINILEGQLTASKKQIEKLEQELKRYKNDLDRSQQSFNVMDMSVSVTPQKSFAASFTPVKFNGKLCESLEVEERKKLETELKILQIKLLNQNSQSSSQNTINHRDIARHQASSSVFSWQQERTPSRASTSSHDTSLKRSFTSTQCPWEQEETPSKRGYKADSSNRSFCEPPNTAANDQLKSQNQELKSKVNELELRLQVQEKELKMQLNKLQETQTLLEKTQAELQEKDKALTKSRDDLARVTTQYDQTADRCAQTEQKLKKVAEELSCQRQNAESARLTVENKLKEREKENQQELLRQQNSLKNMEQQLNQMKTKLSQESQQAKNEFNAIQAELDRAVHAKKVLEGEVEELKQKLFKAEQTLQTSENQTIQLKKNLEEAKSQQNAVRCQLDQKTKETSKLEEEMNIANQTIRQNQQLVDKLTDKNNSLEAELKCALQKLQGHDSSSLQNLKTTVANLEKERDLANEMLNKRANDFEETKNTLARMAEESLALRNQLDCKEKECKDLINTNISLSRWKNEHENVSSQSSIEKEEMLAKVKELESLIQNYMGQIHSLENDKKNLHIQINNLQELVDLKTADLEAQRVTCSKIQQQLESEGQKYQNDIECLVKRIYELEAEVKLRESDNCLSQVNYLEGELQNQKTLNAEVQSKHDELLQSKIDIQNEMIQIKEMHERFVSESQCRVESLQDNISSKQSYVDSVVSAIREKEEEICMLSEKLRLANSDLQSANQSNKELLDKLEELKQLSESWPTERESLTALISSSQKEIEVLTADNKQIKELCNTLQLQKINVELGPEIDKKEKEDCADNVDECKTDDKDVNECESLKMELEKFEEKLSRVQKDNGRLLRANEELTSLVGSLRNNELSLNKIVEDMSVSLKDREMSLKKLQAQLESLKTDCKTEPIPVEDLSESIANLQNSSSKDIESHNNTSIEQETVPSSMDMKENNNQTILSEDCDPLFVDCSQNETLCGINDETLPLSLEPPHREENETLLINLDQLSLTSTEDVTKSLTQLLELSHLPVQNTTSLSPFTSPSAKVSGNETDGETKKDRKSFSGQLVDLILQQAPEEQHVLFSHLTSEDPCSLKDLLTVYQVELGNLRKQHLSDIETWQQKLKDQASEMEAKLIEEKARSEQMAQELEAAKLELQVLDLSARSLLFDSEDLTTRLDATNQSLCTILPIGRLSLGNSEFRKCETPKEGEENPENNSKESLKDASKEEVNENKGKRSSSRQKKKRKTNAEVKPKVENSQLKNAECSNEKEKLLILINEKEKNNQHLVMEVKELSLQMEIFKTELSIKEGQNQELEQKAKELENERCNLMEKIDLISTEKLQSSNRIVDLEKALHETFTATELLKSKISELSELKDRLEMSNVEWKESYLQAENELRRSKSEKVNIENHALSLEADLDSLQSKCKLLQEESEGHLRSLNNLEEVFKANKAEKDQLNQELENLVEEKEELEQMYKKLKEKETELESNKENSKELIKILEADIRALKEEIVVAKSAIVALTAEKDNMTLLKENDNLQIQELQQLVQQIQEQKQHLFNERQELETQLSSSNGEKVELSRSLELCQVEKHEMATRFRSAQEEVALMRTGIEKLKVKIESDEKKKRQTIEKLKDSERKFDSLNDKIESLERELVMAEENLENAILQTESATEEVESLKSQKEALQKELNSLRKKLVYLENELENSRGRIIELETTILTLTETLEKRESEYSQLKQCSKGEFEMREEKEFFEKRCEAIIAEHAEIKNEMEQERAQLIQQLEEAQVVSNDLKESVDKLLLEVDDCNLQLAEKTQHLMALETQLKESEESSEKDLQVLQSQMNDLSKQKVLSEQRCEAVLTERTTKMEQEKAQLVQQLEEARMVSSDLKESVDKLTLELEECKIQLVDRTQHLIALETQLKDSEEGKTKYSSECSTFEQEMENLRSEKMTLLSRLEELHNKLQTVSEENESHQAIISDFKTSCDDLKTQLESTNSENRTLLEKVAKLTEDCSNLQNKLHESELQVKTAEDRSCQDRKALEEEMQTIRRLQEENSAQLHSATRQTTELKETITRLRNELETQAMIHKNDIAEYEQRRFQSESLHKSLLDDAVKKHKEDIDGYQKKLFSMEELIATQIQEIDGLKASNREVNESLCKTQEQLVGLKAHIDHMTKKNATASEALNRWVMSCKQLEMEKEELKKQITQQEETLATVTRKQEKAGMDSSADDLLSELEELKQCLEEKTQEADDNIEKYCNLMIKTHRLEESNDYLKKQVDFLNSRLKEFEVKEKPECQPSASDKPLPEAENKRRKSRRSSQGPRKQTNKRQRDMDNTGSAPTTPQCVTKKVKKTSGTLEEEEFEPEGLPEVVKKGFADIPSGKQSPFVLRRATVPLRKSPRLASQKNSPSLFGTHMDNLENLDDLSILPPGGSKPQEFRMGQTWGPIEQEACKLSADIVVFTYINDMLF
uniref:Centromere protein F n=1 Tax=Pyxicephalus adspersus TaxID=30357 RepID=A0AAV3AT32_PYXAD|nr:TPA: hypothetical protein GDO54_011421 [Pyxicephalus adspersus]